MSRVEQLLSEYITEYRNGGRADPVAFLERAEPDDRRELAALIDGYLARAPRRPFDESAFRGSSTEEVTETLARSLAGVSGLWPVLLPRLRAAAGLKRRELVERLAIALGASGREEKVGGYYHEMEQGLLPASGVSDCVLGALAQITGTTLSALRDAGAAVTPSGGGKLEPRSAFARAAFLAKPGEEPREFPSGSEQQIWDEIDELFQGGG
jgi:hypothetical protein